GLPYTIGFTLTLAFRLVPVFFDAALSVVQAQRCRGLEFGRGGLVARLRRFVPIIVPVLIGALRRADRMAMALELRGFNSGRPRTTYLRARAGRADVLAGSSPAAPASGRSRASTRRVCRRASPARCGTSSPSATSNART